ncbi:MAG: hypothetical protein N3D10_03870 [Candidatus Micrarchaeota archaeon]|nr:hypothetical protein [Candidatus Micrarchaeota archaeon]
MQLATKNQLSSEELINFLLNSSDNIARFLKQNEKELFYDFEKKIFPSNPNQELNQLIFNVYSTLKENDLELTSLALSPQKITIKGKIPFKKLLDISTYFLFHPSKKKEILDKISEMGYIVKVNKSPFSSDFELIFISKDSIIKKTK